MATDGFKLARTIRRSVDEIHYCISAEDLKLILYEHLMSVENGQRIYLSQIVWYGLNEITAVVTETAKDS